MTTTQTTTQPQPQAQAQSPVYEKHYSVVITHDGLFHADEVFAIALLRLLHNHLGSGDFMVNRTRATNTLVWAKSQPDVFVIDVGGEYEPMLNNFDHHQDANLPASNMLVFRAVWHLLFTERVAVYLEQGLMQAVSDWDTNANNCCNRKYDFPVLSQIIAGYNRDPNNKEEQDGRFRLAVEIAFGIILNEWHKATERIKAEDAWEKRKELTPECVIFDNFCPIWKEYNYYPYAIQPNPQGWALMSADSEEFPLPTQEQIAGIGIQPIFVHKGRFIAIFSTLEDAKATVIALL